MPRVPSLDTVQAREVTPGRTQQPSVRAFNESAFRGQDAAGVALQHAGQAFSGVGEDLAAVGVVEAKREQARKAQDAITKYKQSNFDLQYGEDGFRSKKGQNALDAAEAFHEATEKRRREFGNALTDPESRRLYENASQAEKQAMQVRVAEHTLAQQKVAQDNSDTARIAVLQNEWLAEPRPNSASATAHNQSRKVEMIQMLQEMMDRDGITDPDLRQFRVQTEMSQLHGAMVQRLLDEGDARSAEMYFKRADAGGEILPSARAGLVKIIDDGSVLQQAQEATDTVVNDPTLTTAKDRREAVIALTKGDPKVREEAEKQMRLHNAAVQRERAEQDRITRAEARTHIENGGSLTTLTVRQNEVIDRTVGMRTGLERRALDIASGRPPVSDEALVQEMYTLAIDDPAAFLQVDWTQPKYLALSAKQIDKFRNVQLSIDRKEAAATTAEKKRIESGARQTRIHSALIPVFSSLKLGNASKVEKQRRGRIEQAVLQEAERRIEGGEKLTDAELQNMARNAYLLEGEDTASGFFVDPDVRLFNKVLGDAQEFDPEDFTTANQEVLDSIHRKMTSAGITISPEQTAALTYKLAREGKIPTALTVHREAERQLKLQRSTPAVPEKVSDSSSFSLVSEAAAAESVAFDEAKFRQNFNVKENVDLSDLTVAIISAADTAKAVYDEFGVEMTITSGREGKHRKNSKHFSGDALDLRTRTVPAAKRRPLTEELQKRLGKDYDVLLEKDHIHIEFDPK